jgi:hypothetical protein
MSRVHFRTKFSRFFLLWPAHEFFSSSATDWEIPSSSSYNPTFRSLLLVVLTTN